MYTQELILISPWPTPLRVSETVADLGILRGEGQEHVLQHCLVHLEAEAPEREFVTYVYIYIYMCVYIYIFLGFMGYSYMG